MIQTHKPPKLALLTAMHNALNRDFCPWANRWVYWLKAPVWSVVIAAAVSLLCGILLNTYILALSAFLWVVLGLGIVWPWISVRGIDGEVTFSKSRCREGETVTVQLRVTNRWPWPVWGLYVEQGFFGETSVNCGAALARIPAWQTSEFQWTFRPHARGIYPNAPPRIETGFPFGIVRASTPIESPSQLIVWPKTVALNAIPDTTSSHQSEDRFTDRRAGDYGDMLGTREFRQGDSLRRVHWAQTARRGEMVVCERQSAVATSVRVLLDVATQHHVFQPLGSTLETAIRVAASICESVHRQHGRVECIIGEDCHVCDGDTRKLMDAFARIPVRGLAATGVACPSARAGEPIVITTDRASDSSLYHAGHRRAVILTHDESARSSSTTIAREPVTRAGCPGRAPWMQIERHFDLAAQLPRLWRKACHVG